MFKKLRSSCPVLASLFASGIFFPASPVQAANWLILTGTEPAKAPDSRIVGFVQPAYTHHEGSRLRGLLGGGAANNGNIIGENLVGPRLDQAASFHLRRAKLGIRGRLSEAIDYLAMVDVAGNSMSYQPFDNRSRYLAVSDLSMTFKHIPGAKLRVGLFKNPGPEETMPAGKAFDYVEFTDFTRRVMQERFVTGGRKPGGSPLASAMGTETSEGYGFSGFRDWGIQLFDQFRHGNWDLGYAVKLGRGEALYAHDEHYNPELYLYASAEYALPGGKGAGKNGLKLLAWHQQGKREFDTDPTGTEYDRIRKGIGFRLKGKLPGSNYTQRIGAEWMHADGMLLASPAGNVPGGNLQYAAERGNKARGWYIDYGFYLNRQWEFDLRYDQTGFLYQQHRTINPGNERKIKSWTVGVNYRYSPKVRLTVNYSFKNAVAPEPYQAVAGTGFTTAAALVNTRNSRNTVKTLDDRLAVQLTWEY